VRLDGPTPSEGSNVAALVGGAEAAVVERSGKGPTGTLGTFVGVFTPSILTILGIILFLRLGYVVGNGGLRNALIIIGIATVVSTLTSISLAAIATNMEVRGGGDYYLISRTLGIEFGGAIGIVLFLAQSVSIAFYAIGFGEAISAIVGTDWSPAPQVIAAGAVAGLFALAWLGADAASKFQFIVMGLLIAALTSFYIGAFAEFDSGLLAQSWSAPAGAVGFWAVFAIFFPAVTGFTQGVSMSGDLRDPGKSLPTGTFAAVGLSTVVYGSAAVLLAASVALPTLISDTGAMASVAALGVLIDAGVVAATLSSAMASFLGAPRILQSLASDRIFPLLNIFSKGHGPTSNPRRGVLLSLAIAMATISLGSLNVIAPIVSMFFLISYGLLNYATYYEARASSPSFRPRFRYFHRRLSLAGAIASFGAMIAINPVAGVAAIIVLFGISTYLSKRRRPERWADASHSHYFQRAKESIRLMTGEADSSRNWRPQVLAFSADPHRRERLMQFSAWLEGASGLSAVVHIMQGSGAVKRRDRAREQASLRAQIDELGLDVHSLVVLAPDPLEALPIVVQSYGLGPLRANTVLFGWPEDPAPERRADYRQTVREVMRLGVNVVAVSSDAHRWGAMKQVPHKQRRIDVWWTDGDSGKLALLAAYLFTRTRDWRRARIRLIGTADSDEAVVQIREDFAAMLDGVRIEAEPIVLVNPDREAIVFECAETTLVLVPAKVRRDGMLDPLGGDLYATLGGLPMAAAVIAGAPVDLEAGPESERFSEISGAEERVEVAETRLKRLESQLRKIDLEVADLTVKAERNGSSDDIVRLEAAEARQADVSRRTLKAKAVLETAVKELTELIEGARRS